mmetsp:Transcript_99877/g.172176  ORF Transcript_99877/g.172176 Transcript_99877/m.172176 type:complete len:204 (+) Transcript_99877:1449-2060(+)
MERHGRFLICAERLPGLPLLADGDHRVLPLPAEKTRSSVHDGAQAGEHQPHHRPADATAEALATEHPARHPGPAALPQAPTQTPRGRNFHPPPPAGPHIRAADPGEAHRGHKEHGRGDSGHVVWGSPAVQATQAFLPRRLPPGPSLPGAGPLSHRRAVGWPCTHTLHGVFGAQTLEGNTGPKGAPGPEVGDPGVPCDIATCFG